MKIWRSWKGKAALGLVGAVLLALGAWPLWQGPGGGSPAPLSPSLALAAPEVQLPNSFDTASAGMSGYLYTGTSIDLGKVEIKLSPIYGRGPEHVVGGLGTVLVYAEKSGWLVAYTPRDQVTSRIAPWTIVQNIPQANDPLKSQLKTIVETLGLDWATLEPKVGFYHWGFPTATKLVYFARGTYTIPATATFLVPSTYAVLEASWFAWASYSSGAVQVDDGARNLIDTYWAGYYSKEAKISPLSLGTTHTVKLTPPSGGWTGVAVALVLK